MDDGSLTRQLSDPGLTPEHVYRHPTLRQATLNANESQSEDINEMADNGSKYTPPEVVEPDSAERTLRKQW